MIVSNRYSYLAAVLSQPSAYALMEALNANIIRRSATEVPMAISAIAGSPIDDMHVTLASNQAGFDATDLIAAGHSNIPATITGEILGVYGANTNQVMACVAVESPFFQQSIITSKDNVPFVRKHHVTFGVVQEGLVPIPQGMPINDANIIASGFITSNMIARIPRMEITLDGLFFDNLVYNVEHEPMMHKMVRQQRQFVVEGKQRPEPLYPTREQIDGRYRR